MNQQPVSKANVPQAKENVKYSLSEQDERSIKGTPLRDLRIKTEAGEDLAPVAPAGTYNVYGKDIALDDDFAPLPEGYEAKQSSESRNTPAPSSL